MLEIFNTTFCTSSRNMSAKYSTDEYLKKKNTTPQHQTQTETTPHLWWKFHIISQAFFCSCWKIGMNCSKISYLRQLYHWTVKKKTTQTNKKHTQKTIKLGETYSGLYIDILILYSFCTVCFSTFMLIIITITILGLHFLK